MERKRVKNLRIYIHRCPAHRNQERQISEEICPDCGQHGKFDRWSQGIYSRIGKVSWVLGFTCIGPQMTFLPEMRRHCERCGGEGILLGDDFDYECPDCGGWGSFLTRSEAEMQKIRRWAILRHARWVAEKNNPNESDDVPPAQAPRDLILDRNPATFVSCLMEMKEYSRKFSERNRQIGELMLKCNDQGWDIFMEMIELWEGYGRGLAVTQDAILLNASPRKNAVTLLSLYPPSNEQPLRIRIHQREIRRKFGEEKEKRFREFIAQRNQLVGEWIMVSEKFTMEEARDWIRGLLLNAK